MTREQIEKAWEEHTLCNPSMMDELSLNERQAFVKGAQWRINSVWHDASEEPEQKDEPILIEYSTCGIDGFCYMVCDDILDYDIQRHVTYCTVLRWAYLDDLLSERKEETE